jgi:hypothetical protein
LATRIFSTLCAIPSYRRPGSRTSGGTSLSPMLACVSSAAVSRPGWRPRAAPYGNLCAAYVVARQIFQSDQSSAVPWTATQNVAITVGAMSFWRAWLPAIGAALQGHNMRAFQAISATRTFSTRCATPLHRSFWSAKSVWIRGDCEGDEDFPALST